MGIMKDLIYNGQSLNSLGFAIKTRPIYTVASRSINFQSVLGRSGDVIVDNQRYENVEMSYQINSIPHRVVANSSQELVHALIDWLSPLDGEYKILRDDWNSGYFCKAICTNIGEIANNLFLGLDTTIKFNRTPFWYSDLGQKTVAFNSSGATRNNFRIYNPEIYQSEPLIKIYGKGNIDLIINNDNIYYHLKNVDDYIVIDCETGNATKDGVMHNEVTGFDYPPVFYRGENVVSVLKTAGATFSKAEITPNWRRL